MKHPLMKLAVAPLAFVVILVISQVLFKSIRADLTEQNIYSLSQGTENILSNLEQDVTLTLFYSDKASKDLTALRSYAEQVQELLAEYALLADGKLTVEIVDPVPFSEEEDRAAEEGLQAVPLATGDDIYFGLSAKNESGNEAVLPFLQPDKEAFLEYEITELIYRLSQKTVPVIGLMSELDIRGGFDMQRGGATPPWTIYEQLDQLYDVRWVDEQLDEIDPELQLLILVQPSSLDENSLYHVDQYVMNGGKVLAFVDPKAETKQANPMGAEGDTTGLNPLAPLFEAWGVTYTADEVVADAAYGLTVSMGQGRPPVRHLGLLGVQIDGLNGNEIAMAELEVINFASAGVLKPKEVEGIQFDPLIWSSAETQLVDINQYNMIQDPTNLMRSFQSSGENHVIAARMSGKASSAFEAKPESSDYQGEHVASTENLNVIVVADTDLLSDRLWVQVQNFFGQRIVQPWADNGAFVTNVVEQYLGSSDLINIRSRGRFARPFEVVQDLQQQAERAYLDNEQVLQRQLEETEQQLAELEQQRDKDSMTLSPEQEAALANFQREKLRIRKALRDVQHALNEDIEQLGAMLKVLNIGVFPLILTALLLLVARRITRRA